MKKYTSGFLIAAVVGLLSWVLYDHRSDIQKIISPPVVNDPIPEPEPVSIKVLIVLIVGFGALGIYAGAGLLRLLL
jgi:hypothetical protein